MALDLAEAVARTKAELTAAIVFAPESTLEGEPVGPLLWSGGLDFRDWSFRILGRMAGRGEMEVIRVGSSVFSRLGSDGPWDELESVASPVAGDLLRVLDDLETAVHVETREDGSVVTVELGSPPGPARVWLDEQGRVRQVVRERGLPPEVVALGLHASLVEAVRYVDFGVATGAKRPRDEDIGSAGPL